MIMKICIIDYGMGNLHSVNKAFRRLQTGVTVSSDPRDIERADKLVLPGVGHFSKGMDNLNKLGLIGVLNYQVIERKKPVLGICLGMQLMTQYSEEGACRGLAWVPALTKRFPDVGIRIPHIGWNNIEPASSHPLLHNILPTMRFYFVHSYYVICDAPTWVGATTKYGIEFHSVVVNDNIMGVQFHPEKSHGDGLHLLENFIKL